MARFGTCVRHGRWRIAVTALAFGLLSTMVSQVGFGQDYLSTTPNAGLSKESGEIKTILREAKLPADKPDMFDEFFKDYLFAQLGAAANLNTLPKVRKEFKIYFNVAKPGPPRERLLNLAIAEMKNYVSKNYPPVVRYNAMTVLKDLNETESSPAKPLPAALEQIFLKVIAAAKFPDYLKQAALIGIERHAEMSDKFPLPPNVKAQLAVAMLKLVKEKDPPKGRTAAGQTWMRKSAAQSLAYLRTPGGDGAIVKVLHQIVQDPKEPRPLRGKLSQLLGQFNYPANSKLDFKMMANDVGHVALAACRAEIPDEKPAKAANEPNKNAKLEPGPKKRMLTYVSYAYYGIEGMKGAVPPDDQSFVTGIYEQLGVLRTALEKQTATLNTVDKGVKDLEKLLKPQAAPDLPAPDTAADKTAADGKGK